MESVALTLARLPRYLVVDPTATVRFEVRLDRPSSEIDVELDSPQPGRSFLLLVGPRGGPVLQRMRLSGRARILFEPNDDRTHVLMFANPQKEPLVLKIRGHTARGRPDPARRESRPWSDGLAARRSPPLRRGARRLETPGVVSPVAAGARPGPFDPPARRARPKA